MKNDFGKCHASLCRKKGSLKNKIKANDSTIFYLPSAFMDTSELQYKNPI